MIAFLVARAVWFNVALASVAGGGAGLAYLGLTHTGSAAAAEPRTVAAQRGTVLSTVSATGNVATPDQLDLNFQTGGTLTQLAVRQGQRVKRGQVLARVDSADAEVGVRSAQAGLRSAQARLQQLLDGLSLAERKQNAVAVTQAEVALANAKATLRQTRASNAVSQSTSTLSLAQARAQLKRDRAQKISDTAALAKARTAVTSAQSSYDVATASVNSAKEGVTSAQDALAAAQTKQTQDQAQASKNASQLSTNQGTLSQAQSQLQSAEASLSAAQSQLQSDQQACSADPSSSACGKIAADQASVSQAQAAVHSAQDSVSSAQGAVDSGRSQASGDTDTATSNTLNVAAANRAVSTAQSKLSDAQSAQQEAKTDLTSAQADVTTLENAIETGATKLITDQDQIDTLSGSDRSNALKNTQSVTAAEQAIAIAHLSKKAAVLARQVKEQPTKTGDLEAARASVVTADVALTTARETLAETVLRAPASGTVASVSGQVGQTVSGGGSGGGSTATGTDTSSSALVTLVDLGGLEVTAGFSETDAAKIRLGQTATVTLDALPDTELAAQVAAIDTLSTVLNNVVTYNVTFVLDNDTSGVKPGMSASVDVVIAERSGVVTVPTSAVLGSGAASRVAVMRDGEETMVPVATGLQGDSTTQIVTGLQPGDLVVLPSVTATAGTAATPGAGAGPGLGGGFGGGVPLGGGPP